MASAQRSGHRLEDAAVEDTLYEDGSSGLLCEDTGPVDAVFEDAFGKTPSWRMSSPRLRPQLLAQRCLPRVVRVIDLLAPRPWEPTLAGPLLSPLTCAAVSAQLTGWGALVENGPGGTPLLLQGSSARPHVSKGSGRTPSGESAFGL